jgi:hypothetical protein
MAWSSSTTVALVQADILAAARVPSPPGSDLMHRTVSGLARRTSSAIDDEYEMVISRRPAS